MLWSRLEIYSTISLIAGVVCFGRSRKETPTAQCSFRQFAAIPNPACQKELHDPFTIVRLTTEEGAVAGGTIRHEL